MKKIFVPVIMCVLFLASCANNFAEDPKASFSTPNGTIPECLQGHAILCRHRAIMRLWHRLQIY